MYYLPALKLSRAFPCSSVRFVTQLIPALYHLGNMSILYRLSDSGVDAAMLAKVCVVLVVQKHPQLAKNAALSMQVHLYYELLQAQPHLSGI